MYPKRCQIVNVDGEAIPGLPGVIARTPEVSRPHIGKFGTAEEEEVEGFPFPVIKITVDDGSIIYGHECWWVPVEQDK